MHGEQGAWMKEIRPPRAPLSQLVAPVYVPVLARSVAPPRPRIGTRPIARLAHRRRATLVTWCCNSVSSRVIHGNRPAPRSILMLTARRRRLRWLAAAIPASALPDDKRHCWRRRHGFINGPLIVRRNVVITDASGVAREPVRQLAEDDAELRASADWRRGILLRSFHVRLSHRHVVATSLTPSSGVGWRAPSASSGSRARRSHAAAHAECRGVVIPCPPRLGGIKDVIATAPPPYCALENCLAS